MLVGTRLVSGVYSIGELDVVAFGESLYLFYCKWRDCGHLVGKTPPHNPAKYIKNVNSFSQVIYSDKVY